MIKLLKNLTKKEWFLALISLILIIVQVWLELKMPDYMSEITVLVQTEGSQMSDIIKNGAYMLGCAFGSLVSAVIVGYLVATVAANFSKSVRKKLFDKVEDLAMSEVKGFSTSSLITRTTNDITQVQMLVAMGLQLMIKAPITAIWAITKILNKSWQWSMTTGIAVLILLTVISILTIIVMPRFKIVQKLTDKINGVTRENLTGIRVVRAFNAENYQENKFEDVNTKLTNQQMYNQKKFAIMQPVMYLVMYFLTLAIYFIGAYLIRDASMVNKLGLFGDMVVFSSYAMQVIMSFLMLAMIFMMLPRAQVSANRINEVLDTDITIKDGNINTNKTNEVGTVEFKNVSFKYDKKQVLNNINFNVKSNETVAFVGKSGAGKTTIFNLLCKMYDSYNGTITIDGTDIKNLDKDTIRGNITIVSQSPYIFNMSIRENLRLVKQDLTDEEMKQACKMACLDDYIEQLPQKYDTIVGEGGVTLSGGQKQRLAIARAFVQKTEIILLDEATSSLDNETQLKIQQAIENLQKEYTILIIAHRLSTVRNADRILMLSEGKIIAEGNHSKLIKECKKYRDLYENEIIKEV